MADARIQRIAIVGFGEVGGIFGRDFSQQGIDVSVFDILLHSAESRDAMLSKARECAVRACETLGDCPRDAELVISAVTATSALDVARKRLRSSAPISFSSTSTLSPPARSAELRPISSGSMRGSSRPP